jgi:hypothetical protein
MNRRDYDRLRDAIAVRAAGGWVLWEGADRLGGLGTEDVALAGDAVLRWGGRLWRVTEWRERGGELRLKVRSAFGRVGASLRIAPDGEGPLAWGPDWFDEAVERAREGIDGVSIAVPPDAANRTVDDALAAGLVARDRYEASRGRPFDLVVYSVPPALRIVAERVAWLTPKAAVRLVDVATGAVVRPHDQGTLAGAERAVWPRPVLPPSPIVERILALAPGVLVRARRPAERSDRVLLRGLEVARVGPAGASFGVGRRRERLDARSWQRLEALVRELELVRSPDPPDRNHPAYRMFPERWLASALAADPATIDPSLDPTTIYEQVPARRGDSRERIDLLAVTRTGRLAVVELKAAEDRALPLQGLDYWSRVQWHHARGEITRRGYFPGVGLDPRPPLLFLVAPLFRFHASVRVALDLFAPEVEAVAVGLNTDWRRAPRAIARFRKRD